MSEETTNTAVPKLRFPEFRKNLGWPKLTLTESLHEHRLKSDGKSEVHSVSVHKGVINQVEHLGRSFSAADTSKYSLAKPFDIIYTKSPTGDFPYGVVKQNLTGKNVIISPLYGVFAPSNQYVGNLIHAYFEDPGRTSNYLVSLVQKGAKNTLQISNDRFLSKEIYLPTNEAEQQKIAAALSSLDDLLTVQSAKLVALQAHKRGLMQGLFPAEGETVPKLRFPEFQEAAGWKKVKLSTQVELISGLHLSPDEYAPQGDIPYFSGPADFANDLALVSKWTLRSANIGRAGDTLITVKGSGAGGLFHLEIDEVALGRQLMAVRALAAHSGFISHFLATQKQRLASLATGNLIPGLSRVDILGLNMLITSLAEQQKIAATLTSLDNRITTQTQQIEALKLHKKGLMQGLFPAAAEPTA